MRNIILFMLCISFVCCHGSASDQTELEIQATNTIEETSLSDIEGAYLKFLNNRFDFGKASRKKHPDITIDVEFSNSGNKPLVILKADVSCGCLSVEYPKEPIMPDQSARINSYGYPRPKRSFQ